MKIDLDMIFLNYYCSSIISCRSSYIYFSVLRHLELSESTDTPIWYVVMNSRIFEFLPGKFFELLNFVSLIWIYVRLDIDFHHIVFYWAHSSY